MAKKMRVLLTALVSVCGVWGALGDEPRVVIPEKPVLVERYADGLQAMLPCESTWRYMCGSDTTGFTNDDLMDIAASCAALGAQGVTATINNTAAQSGFDVVFNIVGSIPIGAADALAVAETVIESAFTDPITVTIELSFADLGPTVLGSTGSFQLSDSWSSSRAGLVSGMDSDDTIQSFLPIGGTIPVRYDASSAAVTDENQVFWTTANYRATIGSVVAPVDATMQYSNQFSWDFDPSNGISGGAFSFVDVVIHEVGHAMGFVSGVDFRFNDINSLDIYRFQFTDGAGDYNPDDTAEFQTTPRTADFNNPNDDAVSDIISGEYRMSDGDPNQASHFREQGGCSPTTNIGIMDPLFSSACTFLGRGYFSDADLDMFDAIGYDYVAGSPPSIVAQPSSTVVCAGDTAELTVVATGDAPLSYQWFNIFLVPIPGATGATLSIPNAQESDDSFYFCTVTNPAGAIDSFVVAITVDQAPSITSQPGSQTVDEGDDVTFTVIAAGDGSLGYQWRQGGVDITGETSASYTINGAIPADDGAYDVRITNACGEITSAEAVLTVTPGVCLADVNGDGNLDPLDFNAWLSALNGDLPGCDQNGDGICEPIDFAAWLGNYNAGCP